MDLLFRLRQKEEGFEDIDATKQFFLNTIPDRDKNYFYDTRQNHQVSQGEKIVFTFDSYIVATAIFEGEIIKNSKRDKKYIYGHKISNIQIINTNIRLNSEVFGTRTTYIKTKNQKEIIQSILEQNIDIYPDEINEDFYEGSQKKVYVNQYERDPKARQACLEKKGYICEICEFDFEKKYGEIGKNAIHVHHIMPLHKTMGEYKVDPIKDLMPVCPNCHLILHRKGAPTVEELKKIVKIAISE